MRLTDLRAAAAAILLCGQAQAADWLVGFGVTDFSRDIASDEVTFSFELHADPFGRMGRFDIGVAGAFDVDAEGDYWAGLGLAALSPIGTGPWFVEASFMSGFYEESIRENDLGGNLQFRSLIGIGYTLGNGARISLAASHKSNAGIEEENPGANTVSLRYRRGF